MDTIKYATLRYDMQGVLKTESFEIWNTIDLMCAPEGNSEFCFLESLNVSRDEVEGNIEARGKTKLTISRGSTHIKCFVMHCVSRKNFTLWNLNYLQAIVLIWQLWMLRINDPQKRNVLHTWELYDNITDCHCVEDLAFWRIINSKLLELSYFNTTACR